MKKLILVLAVLGLGCGEIALPDDTGTATSAECYSSAECAPPDVKDFAQTYCCSGPQGRAGTCQPPTASRGECRP